VISGVQVFGLAGSTEIVIIAHFALEANARDRRLLAAITSDSFMHDSLVGLAVLDESVLARVCV